MIEQFKDYLKSLDRSENTIINYYKDIKKAINEQIMTDNFSHLDMQKLSTLPVSAATKHRIRSSIRKYAKFLVTNNIIEAVPPIIDAIELPKITTKMPNVTRPNKVRELAEKNYSKELKAMLYIMGTTGCRISSLSSIDIEDIQDDSILLKTKGNKFHTTFITRETKEAIDSFVDGRTNGPLFLTKGKRTSPDLLRMRMRREMGEDYVNAHSIRHGLATQLIENGADMMDVKEILNHTNITVTQRYIHMSANHIKERVKKSHPWL